MTEILIFLIILYHYEIAKNIPEFTSEFTMNLELNFSISILN